MKTKKLRAVIPVMALIFGIVFSGCHVEIGDETYTIWTAQFRFSDTDSTYGTLQDGYFRNHELSQFSFEWEREHNYQNADKKDWTEDQIYSYFVGLGFSSSRARSETDWLISVNHGEIGIREGSTLRTILK